MAKTNGKLAYRVDQLEKSYGRLDGKISKLLENDLPHINEAIISLKTRMNVLTAMNIGAIIIGILATRLLT